MTALIKMEQIEKVCVTMELYNCRPQPAFVLKLAFHQDRRIGEGRREEDIEGSHLSVGCSCRKEEVVCDDVNDDTRTVFVLFLYIS